MKRPDNHPDGIESRMSATEFLRTGRLGTIRPGMSMADVIGAWGQPTAHRLTRPPFIHTLPRALALGARIGTPNVGLLMDTWHLVTSGGTPADMRSLHGEQVVHAHVNDAPVGVALEELIDTERLLPGASGVIDARAFLTVLDKIAFDGPALVEPFNAEVRALAPGERVAAVAASLQSVWP